MARRTERILSTSPEVLEKVNKQNRELSREFYRYLRSVKRSPGTIKGYENDLDIFFSYLYKECENKSIIDCKMRDYVNFQWFLLESGELSPARIRRIKSSISSFSNAIELLYSEEFPNFRNLIRKVESPKNEPVREKTILSQEQIETLLSTLIQQEKYEEACCIALAAYSGRRKSELLRFKMTDFDDDKILFGTLYKSDPIKLKGRSGGKYANCYTLVKQFKPYLDLWIKERERLGIDSIWLFPDKIDPTDHRPVSSVDTWMAHATTILGVDVYAHSFRHAYVTFLAAAGLPNSVIVEIMRWEKSTGDSMVSIYNDTDISEDLEKYFSNGEIIAQENKGVSDL